jgi:hypothetical protein
MRVANLTKETDMISNKGKRTVVAFAATVAVLAFAATGLGDTSFTDRTGDGGSAPDITQVVASNDTTGVITFRVTTVAPLPNTDLIFIDLDADGNQATGDHGAEYGVVATLGGSMFLKWDGAAWARASAPSLSMTINGSVTEIKLGKQEIGNASRFGFIASTVAFDSADKYLGEDNAPDGGWYAYVLTYPQCSNGTDDDGDGKADGQDLGCSSATDDLESDDPVNLRAGKATVTPAKPQAGKRVVVSAPVTRVETGLGVSSGSASCVVHYGPKTLRSTGKVAGGRASCTFVMPLGAKGKTASGTISVTVLGHSTTAPFAFKVI